MRILLRSTAICLLASFQTVSAQLRDEPNHPELNWKVLETPHFKVYYHQGLDGFARRAAGVAEQVFGPVTELYQFVPDNKVRMILKDTDDYANGAAYYYHNTIEIWASSLDFELRGSTDWLSNVVTHELSHIISLQTARKASARIPAIYFHVLGYQSEGRREDILTGYPNILASYAVPTIQVPPWYAEGTAQYMARGAHHDNWDSHRDMILRVATLDGSLLSYDEMSVFGAKSGLGLEKVYDHGYSLVLHIVNNFGDAKLREIYRNTATWWRTDFGGAVQEALGISMRELHGHWVAALEERYRIQEARIGADSTASELIHSDGYFNLHPKWSPDGKRLAYLSNAASDFGRTNLYVFSQEDDTAKLGAPGVTSAFDWSPDGSSLLFSRRSPPERHGSRFRDLYTVDPSATGKKPLHKVKEFVGLPQGERPGEVRLTHGLRGAHPSVSPDGTEVAFVKNAAGTTNLGVMDIRSKQVRFLTRFDDGTQIYTPRWSPQGESIAVSVFKEGRGRDIAVIDADGEDWSYVVASSGTDRDPCWTSHGTGLVFASDLEGIFDLYHINLADGAVDRLTRVLGGALQPDINPVDGRIAYAHYGPTGYEIRSINGSHNREQVDPRLFRDVRDASTLARFASTDTAQSSRRYGNEFSNLLLLPRIAWDDGKPKVGFFATSDDVLRKQTLFLGGMVSPNRDLDLFGIFEYRRWRPTVFFEVYRQSRHVSEDVVNRDEDFRIFNRTFALNEIDLGVRTQMSRGDILDARLIYSRYGVSIEQARFNGFNRVTLGATYLNGLNLAFTYHRNTVSRTIDSEINPSSGRNVTLRYDRFFNYFLNGFKENSSILIEIYDRYFYNQLSLDWSEYLGLGPGRSALGLRFYGGLIDRSVDDFFDFHLGGLPYMKGYTFYGLEGRRVAMFRAAYRFPLWTRIGRLTGPLYSDQVYGALYAGIGRAWDGDARDDILKRGWKRDIGMQVRYDATSFYLFPTRVGFDAAYGFDTVPLTSPGMVGKRSGLKLYFTLLFGYLESVGS